MTEEIETCGLTYYEYAYRVRLVRNIFMRTNTQIRVKTDYKYLNKN